MAEQYGAINISTANAIGAMLNKKMGVQTGFAPKDWPETSNLLVKLPTKTVSGSVASFSDGADTVPLSSCKATIAPNLEGVSSVGVVHCGKNIYDKNVGVYDDNYFNQDGTTAHYADVAVSWIRVKPNTQYTFSLGATPSRTTYLRWINCDKDKNFISRPTSMYGSQNFPYTVTTPNNCQWVQLAINEYPAAQVSSNDWIIQIEENSSSSTYEAYNGTQYTAQLGRTVYGGTADVVSGEGTETYGLQTFDGTETWTLYETSFWYTSKPQTNVKSVHPCVTSNGVKITYGTNGQIRCYISENRDVVDTSTDMNALLSNGVSFNYQLNENVDFTFTGVPIDSYYGVNNVWNNVGGNTEVTYRRDCDLALQESEA